VLKQGKGLPWQRILGSGGRISLRGQSALEQRFLLQAEGVRFTGQRVNLKEFEHQFASTGRKSLPGPSAVSRPRRAKGLRPKL
jgi:hypothetical protein